MKVFVCYHCTQEHDPNHEPCIFINGGFGEATPRVCPYNAETKWVEGSLHFKQLHEKKKQRRKK